MKEIRLPHKVTNELKVNVATDDLVRAIEKLGSIHTEAVNTFNTHGTDIGMVVNDFSKPKNKIVNSKILPELVQSIQIMKVLPHFKDIKLLLRLTEETPSNNLFHQNCDSKGPLLIFVKLDSKAIFGVSLKPI
jgi:hypothetical protein